jgi:hypothetical protein
MLVDEGNRLKIAKAVRALVDAFEAVEKEERPAPPVSIDGIAG